MEMTQKLFKIKEKIDEAKTELAQVQGAKAEIIKRLKEDFNCDNLDSAETLLAEMKEQNEKLEKEIEDSYSQIESELGAIGQEHEAE